jgi:flagellar basal body-associated protein FliL
MAFCNSCGATLTPGTKFCNKCGTPQTAGPSAPAPTPQPPVAVASAPLPAKGGSSALKIILIVVGVIVLIGVLGIASVAFFAYRVAKSAHVTQHGDNVKVETPFGTVESSKDPEKAAAELGIEVYPGAEVQKNGASSATFGNIHTVSATFESSDSLDKVCDFYKAKFPSALTTTSDQSHCTIVSNDNKNMITVNIEANGDTTKFQITNVSKKGGSDSSN